MKWTRLASFPRDPTQPVSKEIHLQWSFITKDILLFPIDTVVFDNSASYLRTKKLRYWVDLISEEEEGVSELTAQMEDTQIVGKQ